MLNQAKISESRQGYLFAYAQISFNQLRRYANLQIAAQEHEAHMKQIRARIKAGDVPTGSEMAPDGWRSFTREFELQAEQLECRILAVLSAALFLEAYIFDYCARRESGKFASKYIDRLDPVAKWIIVPRLIVPPGLDQSLELFERLGKLFRLRNELVHHKTKAAPVLSEPPVFPDDMQPGDCTRLLCDVLRALQAVDPQDDFGAFVLRHVSSWAHYASKNRGFYPILWEA